MPHYYPLVLSCGLFIGLGLSQNSHAQTDNDEDLLALMTLLDSETRIATQNKMNADYVPGMVSVLHGKDLRQMGLTTVADALNQVPGFHATVNNTGDTRVIVRGVGATLNASNLKLLMDGVSVNRATDASADWLLRLPLTQVDRIEVIRGPGSAIYGEFAFSGVVNVISRKANSVATRVGSFNARQLDGHLDQQWDNGASLQLNLAAWSRDNSGLMTKQDNFAGSDHGYSPNRVYDHEEGQVVQTAFNYLGYQLQLHYAAIERGPEYGKVAAMPREFDPFEESMTSFSLSKNWQLTDTLQLDLALTSQESRLNRATILVVPTGIAFPPGSPPAAADQYLRDGNRDAAQRANVGLRWNLFAEHTLFAQWEYAHYEVSSSFLERFSPGTPAVEESTPLTGVSRDLQSLTLQDQWQASDTLEITYGARLDHYDDWGQHLSPRLAAVWRMGENHIFKAQHSEAFRPPTLAEVNTGPAPGNISPTGDDLSEEILKSTEASYIYRNGGTVARVTAFYTHIEDLIESYLQPGKPPVWRNLGDIDSQGVELEWQHRLGRDWEWQTNLSYVEAEDNLDSDGKLLGAINWLANVGVIWHNSGDSQHTLRLRYVGEQEGWEITTKLPQTDRFDDYHTLDYSFALKNLLGVPDLQLSTGINNLLDRGYNSVPSPAQFPQGLPHGQRSAWLQLEYGL